MGRLRKSLLALWGVGALIGWGESSLNDLVGDLLPHAKYPPVMFARVPELVPMLVVEAEHEPVSFSAFNETGAIGYFAARTHMNLFQHPRWVEYLCRRRPGLQGRTLRVTQYSLDAPVRIVRSGRRRCEN